MKDTYSQNTICYLDDVNKYGFAFGLSSNSCSLFKKAFLFQNFQKYEEIILSMDEMAKRGETFFGTPLHEETWKYTEYALHDAIMITAAFENYFKSVLLSKGYSIFQQTKIYTKN